MSEWETKKLGEITDWFSGGTPSKQNEAYWGGDIPWISAKTLKGTRVSESETLITEEGLKSGSRLALKGDLLLLVRGSGLFNSIPISIVDKPVAFNQDIKAIRLKKEYKHISPWFLLYWLHGNKRILNGIMEETGIGAGKFDLSLLKGLTIDIPPQKELEEITKTVKIIDDKLTLLQKQNQTFEELAQTLFKRWFVEFEFPNKNGQPYNSSGGKMVESELGEIPEGWRVGYLNTFISDSIGGDYGKEEPVGDFTEEATCLRGTDLPNMKTGLPERAPVRFIKPAKLKKCKLNIGDIVIEISGGTEGQSTGRAMYINEQVLSHYSRPMTCVNFCRILRPKTIEYSYYCYLLLDFLYSRGVFFNLENGSTGIKNLDLKTILNDYELPIPNTDLVKKFDFSIKGIFEKVQENNKEIQSLTQLCDTLLPKLMSGELKVNVA